MTKTLCDSCGKEGLVNHVLFKWGRETVDFSAAPPPVLGEEMNDGIDLCDLCRDRVREAVKGAIRNTDG